MILDVFIDTNLLDVATVAPECEAAERTAATVVGAIVPPK
jgi:hypothetical protein